MNIRYATEQDLRQWFNGTLPATMRAMVAEDDGRLLGLAGVAFNDDHAQVFSNLKPEMRANRMAVGRLAVKARRMVDEVAGPLWALCSANEPTAPGLLTWGGFKHVSEGVWRRG